MEGGGVGYTHLEVAGQGEEVSSSLHWARRPERREYHWARRPERREYQHTVQVLCGSGCEYIQCHVYTLYMYIYVYMGRFEMCKVNTYRFMPHDQ